MLPPVQAVGFVNSQGGLDDEIECPQCTKCNATTELLRKLPEIGMRPLLYVFLRSPCKMTTTVDPLLK